MRMAYVPARWNGEVITEPERQLQRLLLDGKTRRQSARLMGLTREEVAALEASLRRKGIRPGAPIVRAPHPRRPPRPRSADQRPRKRVRLDADKRRRVGAHLRSLRTSRGMTQAALADGAFTAAFVSMLESGRAAPSLDSLVHFAGRLGVPLRETLPADI